VLVVTILFSHGDFIEYSRFFAWKKIPFCADSPENSALKAWVFASLVLVEKMVLKFQTLLQS
jgi:hypothetical protein